VVHKLQPAQVAYFLSQKANDGLSRATVARLRQVLVKALRSAERDGLVSRNVTSLVPTPRADRVLGRSLTRDQAARLLTTIKATLSRPPTSSCS
jgi:site-specific recombinase XerD